MMPQQYEIWLADLGMIGKMRPVVIVSRNDSDPPRHLFNYVPLTGQCRHSEYEIDLGKMPFLSKQSYLNTQGTSAIPDNRLVRKLGVLPSDKIEALQEALRYLYDL